MELILALLALAALAAVFAVAYAIGRVHGRAACRRSCQALGNISSARRPRKPRRSRQADETSVLPPALPEAQPA